LVAAAHSFCPQCGNTDQLTDRCPRCGYVMSSVAPHPGDNWLDTRLAGDESRSTAVPGAHIPRSQDTVARRPKSSLAVFAVLAVLTVPLIAWWLTRPDTGLDRSASTGRDRSGVAPSNRAPTGPGTDVKPSSAPDRVRCWNGRLAANGAGCPDLTGEAALAWVFPGSGKSQCGPDPDHTESLWIVTRLCEVRVPDSGLVRIHYAETSSVEVGFATYDGAFSAERRATVRERGAISRIEWSDPETDAVRYATAYADHPWVISIEAESAADLEFALSRLVRIRPAAALDAAVGQ
jgi:hypothetical protein